MDPQFRMTDPDPGAQLITDRPSRSESTTQLLIPYVDFNESELANVARAFSTWCF